MREIKFRVWDKRNNKFITWEDDKYSVAELIAQCPEYMQFSQFTGLIDKNGVELYEGDVLKISCEGYVQKKPYEVENMWDIRIAMEDRDSYTRIDSDFEIIGNIYENKELLTNNK